MGKRIVLIGISLLILLNSSQMALATSEKASHSSAVLNTVSLDIPEDTRTKALEKFLKERNSPLSSYAQEFVKAADENHLDWRFLAAISGVESTFGQFLPYNSFNAWGWGIYGDHTTYFSSYDEAISTISHELRQQYMDKWGAHDVYEIGRLYAASPTWAVRVEGYMNQIEQFTLNNPAHLLSISL